MPMMILWRSRASTMKLGFKKVDIYETMRYNKCMMFIYKGKS